MSEQFRDEYKTPWDMPQDIFWNHGPSAEVNRLQWVLENEPKLPLEEIQRTMPFTNRTLAEAGLKVTVQKSGSETKFLG